MLQASSFALAGSLTAEERAAGQVFPSVERIRAVSAEVAAGVMLQAAKQGVAKLRPHHFDLQEGARDKGEVVEYALDKMWEAKYAPLCTPNVDFTPGAN